jgi:hypothetical protein
LEKIYLRDCNPINFNLTANVKTLHLINVVGPARKYIIKNDSLANDSLLEIELELIQNGGAREEE